MVGFFIWGLAGFWDRVKRKIDFEENQSSQSAMKNALREREMERDGSIFIVWGLKLVWVIIRGVFFPIFYIIFMIRGEKEIKEQIEQTQELKATLES
ncbi:MAG: hypothetical protein J1D99_01805 [Campylobacter sp.]|nr:hypothetical protein [Campylobacter sp.]